jgi:hypothetical protein
MANPNKVYKLPCTYNWYYGSAGDYVVIQDYIKIGGREFQIYATGVDTVEI